ncbi:MAG: hypothetical protein ABI347_10420 [Nitrososphaera sp.]|jgi:hypothetical protein
MALFTLAAIMSKPAYAYAYGAPPAAAAAAGFMNLFQYTFDVDAGLSSQTRR